MMEMMEVDAFVADSVVVADGKIYAQGIGWDSILTNTFPFRQSRIGIGVIVRVPWTATNQMHEFAIKIVDADHNPIALADAPPGIELPDGKVRELKGQFNLGRPPLLDAGDSQSVPIALNIDGLEFPKPDTYTIMIAVDATDMRRLPIRVRPAIQMPGVAQAPRFGA